MCRRISYVALIESYEFHPLFLESISTYHLLQYHTRLKITTNPFPFSYTSIQSFIKLHNIDYISNR